MSKPLKKVAEFTDMMATGDYQGFVWGRLGPSDWTEMSIGTNPVVRPELRQAYEHLSEEEVQYQMERIYPEEVMPEGHGNQKGRWRITVEFWPEELT